MNMRRLFMEGKIKGAGKKSKIVGDKEFKMRSFVIRDEDGTEHSTFTGYMPRQAAIKAASKFGGTVEVPTILQLRERGQRKVHVYKAWRELVDAPELRPKWLPAKIYRSFVDKIEIKKLGKRTSKKGGVGGAGGSGGIGGGVEGGE
jgi:hypothetical protein